MIKKTPRLFTLLIALVLVAFIFIKKSAPEENRTLNVPENKTEVVQQEKNDSLVDSSTISYIPKVFPVKIFATDIDTNNVSLEKGYPGECQPQYFDPKTTPFHKVKTGGSPEEQYVVIGPDGKDEFGMMIDGWAKEGEYKIIPPSPFSVTVYYFGCASSFSYVIDLYKNDVRQELYSNVNNFAFSPDKKYLFVRQNILENGTWVLHKKIINIETKEARELPNVSCAQGNSAVWEGNQLLTYVRDLQSDYSTNACLWNTQGQLISHIGTTSYWGAASADYLAEKIGLLPSNPQIFYAYTTDSQNNCSVFLADLGGKKNPRVIKIFNRKEYPTAFACSYPEVDFDLLGLSFESGILKYRIKKTDVLWGDWVSIQNK